MNESSPIYGLMAEFEQPAQIVAAAVAAREAGYRMVDAYTPFPVEGLPEAIGFHRTRLPLIIFIGGLIGCIGGFYMQYWCSAVNYPINVGGRPFNSWPMFIPVTFEMTILSAATAAVIGLFALNGLPMPYHPVFNVPQFAMASRNRFFFCIQADDSHFDLSSTRNFLAGLQPHAIYEVQP
ncbi:MAG TPA: DUF3341 domain-containing protein [Lacipirellulaceae bacterium]|jgi:hypothetical protein|nr:DUF3341 domain-containing protein [Lacipirellulaceae bacterium]